MNQMPRSPGLREISNSFLSFVSRSCKMSMRGLSVGGFCFGEQTVPWFGLAVNNNLLKYYKKFVSGKNLP